jgi:hypothetical protein
MRILPSETDFVKQDDGFSDEWLGLLDLSLLKSRNCEIRAQLGDGDFVTQFLLSFETL